MYAPLRAAAAAASYRVPHMLLRSAFAWRRWTPPFLLQVAVSIIITARHSGAYVAIISRCGRRQQTDAHLLPESRRAVNSFRAAAMRAALSVISRSYAVRATRAAPLALILLRYCMPSMIASLLPRAQDARSR